jgi:hypothetical protein
MNRLDRLTLKSVALRRGSKGNIMVLIGAITLGLIIAVLLFALNYNQLLGASHQHLSAVEAASLEAARDLSRIVIKDKNYGFVALTDYAPIGTATLAPDNKPQPVSGINTILGTARLDCLIANKIGNAELIALAANDAKNARETAHRLQTCLAKALSNHDDSPPTAPEVIAGSTGGNPEDASWYTDMDGNIVAPYADAKRMYESNLVNMANGGKYVVNSFDLKLGYLTQGGSTLTPVPKPEGMSEVQANQKQGRFYKAFVNIPVSGASGGDFYFAGLSAQPALVDARQCVVPGSGAAGDYTEEPRFCSAVKVKAEHQFLKQERISEQIFTTIACAEPSGTPDANPTPVLSVSFPDGFVPGINTIGDLMDSAKLPGPGQAGPIAGGDWPLDPGSKIGPGGMGTGGTGGNTTPSAGEMFGAGLFGWIKDGRLNKNISATHKLMTQPFSSIMSNIGGEKTITAYGSPDANPAFPRRFDLFQAAYADGGGTDSNGYVLTGLLAKVDEDNRWQNLRDNTAAGKQAYNKISNFTSIASGLPNNTAKVLLDDQGEMYSTTGEKLKLSDVEDLWRDIQNTLAAAYMTKAATKVTGAIGNSATALANADATIKACNALIKDQASFTEDGLQKKSDGSWLIGGTPMYPHKTPAMPANLSTPSNNCSNSKCNTAWDDSTFKFFDTSGTAATPNTIPPTLGKSAILEFNKDGEIVVSTVGSLPFQGLPVAEGGEFAVSFDAIPNAPGNLVWTATYRNNTVRPGQGKHGGQPLTGTPVDWCTNVNYLGSEEKAAKSCKGGLYLSLKVDSYGGNKEPAPYDGINGQCGPKGSHGSHGSHGGKKQQGLQGGMGPRGAQPGTGKYDNDIQGFPWGFKYGAQSGADWSTSDVKYQFPEGNKEIKNGDLPCGKALGPLRDMLNAGGGGLPVTPNSNATTLPAGQFATLKSNSGDALNVRASFLCGGSDVDLQMRAPFKILQNMPGTTNGLSINAGSGVVNVGGIPITLPGLKADIGLGSSSRGVIDAGDDDMTTFLPKAPAELD